MNAAPTSQPAAEQAAARKSREPKQRSRRGRRKAADNVRYFVGKPSRNQESPSLDQEVASEAEGLVAAFKSDRRLFLIAEYTVTQHIERSRVTLGKEPAASANQRVSNVNES